MSTVTGQKLAEHYAAAYKQAGDSLASLEAVSRALVGAEEALCPGSAASSIPDVDADEILRDQARNMARALIAYASKAFAPPGGTALSLPADDLLREFLGWGDSFRFDPVQLWAALCDRYANDAEDSVYRQAADRIAVLLGICWDRPRRTAKCVILPFSVRLDPYFNSGERKALHHDSVNRLHELAGVMATFAHWAGHPDVAEAFSSWAGEWRAYTGLLRSRERYNIHPAISVVTYHERFELQLGHKLADQLNVFVSQYSARLAEEAA